MAANEVKNQDTGLGDVEQVLTKTEQYIEQNQKSLSIIVGAIFFIILIFLGYKKFILGPKEKEARQQMFKAEQYFERDSFRLALHGDGNNLGFIDIVNDYGIIKSANLARYYAGICFLKIGDYQQAIDYLEDFDSGDKIVGSLALGAIGDAHMELANEKQAVSFYEKAAARNKNEFTCPYFLLKAAQVYEKQQNYGKALKLLKKIKSEYPESQEGRMVDKTIAVLEYKVQAKQ